MSEINLNTPKTWCPGCGNFSIEVAAKRVIEKIGKENTVITAGIGCHAKIIDYTNVSSFYGLHGRPIPLAAGIKLANPDLKVIAFSGDGDSLNEGISHLIHAAKRNSDITVVLHQNRNFALTIKQFTASSPKGFISNSSPKGTVENPLNALEIVHAAGATFIARTFSGDLPHLENILEEAVKHEGFSFVEVLQPCTTWYDLTSYYRENIYKMNSIPSAPLSKIKEWDYQDKGKIPVGIFKQVKEDVFEEELTCGENIPAIKEIVNSKI